MSFIKAEKKNDGIDTMRELMCSVPGCQNRWSVKIDRPMCSFHQWGPKKTYEALKREPVKYFTEIDNEPF